MDEPTIHFEAQPSESVPFEMAHFISWFNETHHPTNTHVLTLAKASVTHLYFVCIYPFEDENGRIAQALIAKSIVISSEQTTPISLSHTIEAHKKIYFTSLETNNTDLEITD